VFGQRKAEPGRVLTASAAARTLAYYPVIADGQVLVADLTRVMGYDLHTGRLVGRYNLLEDLRKDGQEVSLELPTQPGVRYTLSVADNGIFVRLGNQAVLGTRDRDGSWGDSFLVCLDLHPSRDGTYHRRWRVRASEHAEDRATIFEGSPVVKDGRLYVARARISGTQVTTAIECYSAATGSRHWHQEVCESRELTDGEPRFHHHLLTLAGPYVAYCSHSGAVVALDALTGRWAWAVRYPSRGARARQGSASPRDLAPCLYADGRLFVAPADSDRILCLDAATGRTLWHSQPVEVVHLLGVAGGKLIFTTGLPPRGIQAVESATGKILSTWLSPEGDVPTFGRGLLAGGKVFWPTFCNGLCLLSQEDGRLDPDSYYFGQYLARAPLGNLAFGEGRLAIASAEELRIYVPRRR
jgi:outer membrane protein assembly factor BamB